VVKAMAKGKKKKAKIVNNSKSVQTPSKKKGKSDASPSKKKGKRK
jgi:hypothetical protein